MFFNSSQFSHMMPIIRHVPDQHRKLIFYLSKTYSSDRSNLKLSLLKYRGERAIKMEVNGCHYIASNNTKGFELIAESELRFSIDRIAVHKKFHPELLGRLLLFIINEEVHVNGGQNIHIHISAISYFHTLGFMPRLGSQVADIPQLQSEGWEVIDPWNQRNLSHEYKYWWMPIAPLQERLAKELQPYFPDIINDSRLLHND